MKLLVVILFFILFNHCSFDSKSGIWKSGDTIDKKELDQYREFKTVFINQENFNEEVNLEKSFTFNIPNKKIIEDWNDIHFDDSNNFDNLSFSDEKRFISLSKKISRYKVDDFFLYENDKFIFTDIKGNLIIFSKNLNKVITRYNFYKKNFKKLKKKLNIILDDGIIYVTDNIGYVYAFNAEKKIILWAKNTKIPFRSNLKIRNDKLIAADENNNIYFFNKDNGDILKKIPTEETLIKNSFSNNFSLSKNSILILNTYGSLFSINEEDLNIKWVINLNKSVELNPRNLFNSKTIINDDKNIIVASQEATYIIDLDGGIVNYKFNIVSQVKPLLIGNHLFLISKNDLLICIDTQKGEIIYSYDINKKISDFLKIKKQKALFKYIYFANNKIFILLTNSYVIEFKLNGNLKNIFKLPKKVNSSLLFINDSIVYLDKKRKLITLN